MLLISSRNCKIQSDRQLGDIMEKVQVLYVYTWTDVLNDYNSGAITVIAATVEDARTAAINSIMAMWSGWDEDDLPDVWTIRNIDPKIADLTVPFVFFAPGSA